MCVVETERGGTYSASPLVFFFLVLFLGKVGWGSGRGDLDVVEAVGIQGERQRRGRAGGKAGLVKCWKEIV